MYALPTSISTTSNSPLERIRRQGRHTQRRYICVSPMKGILNAIESLCSPNDDVGPGLREVGIVLTRRFAACLKHMTR
jgi:hypothetical protein